MNRIFAVILLALVATGCASITRGTSEVFVIETTPANARATLSTGLSCSTPCTIQVPRSGDFVVTIELEGYQTVQTDIVSNVDGDGTAGLAGNLLVGGPIGAVVDLGSGAMLSHQPNPLIVTMLPVGAEPAEEGADETPGNIANVTPPE